MFLRRTMLAALVSGAIVVSGCSYGEPALPDAGTLLKDGAATAAGISSTHFTLKANGTVTGLSVRDVEGDLTKANGGGAKGTGTLEVMGQVVDAEFVLVGGSLYIKGPTGGFQQIPQALSTSLYDPSAILDPARGIPKVLAGVEGAQTEDEENVNGVATFRVKGTVGYEAISGLLPGVNSPAKVTIWLTKGAGNSPVKATLSFSDNASVDVTLSDVDKPVTVTPPA